ncbi:MAG TPA: hypothetical protein IAC37_13805 [Candidatus Ventrimonas merdavium]|nr:hypothetical protein [Candidatus Ventrimonas merdavium]
MKKDRAAVLGLTVWMVLVSVCPIWGATGWVREGETWYYYKSDGTLAHDQWVKSGDSLFWIQGDGTMAVSAWMEMEGNLYWLDASGIAATGWQEIDGKWYYFDENHTMATETYVGSYYVGKDGAWIPEK